jgi:phosphatidylglycerophosphatase A
MLLPPYALWLAIPATTAAGFWAIAAAAIDGDPGWVVIDELAGQWITLLGLAHLSLAGLLAAFVVFRVLDITKLGPIGWADRQHGAFGIMADDMVAGAIGALLLAAVTWCWPNLLS